MVDQITQLAFTLAVFVFGEDGYKGLRKRAFGKKTPQKVGNFLCYKKGVGGQPHAKTVGNRHVARVAQDARQHGHAADGRQRPQ